MKHITSSFSWAVLVLAFLPAQAQEPSQTLASTIDVYVFPAKGQDASKQSQEEAECYQWAVGNSGADPFALAKEEDMNKQLTEAEQQAAAQTGQGSGAQGAVRGAAAGALIGEIANDDASKGAAWGAAAGAVRGRRKGAAANQQAQSQSANQSEQRETATAEQIENFKKAFSVCLEAKDYMVKY